MKENTELYLKTFLPLVYSYLVTIATTSGLRNGLFFTEFK